MAATHYRNRKTYIESFGNKIAVDLYNDKRTKALSKFPSELLRVARRKILYIHDADQLIDLKVPPGNRLEALKGDLKGYHSIRISNQWRVIFKWNGGAEEVQRLGITTNRRIL